MFVNHGVASGAFLTLTDNVVGTGLRLAAGPDYKSLGKDKEWADEWSSHVESLWRSWAETTDRDAAKSLIFSGLTSQVFRSSILNGEALALPLWLKERRFSTVLQLVEGLPQPWSGGIDLIQQRGVIDDFIINM